MTSAMVAGAFVLSFVVPSSAVAVISRSAGTLYLTKWGGDANLKRGLDAPAPSPASAARASPGGAPDPCFKKMPLKAQEQGFDGKTVEHSNGKTSVSDWGKEYGHGAPSSPEQAEAQYKEEKQQEKPEELEEKTQKLKKQEPTIVPDVIPKPEVPEIVKDNVPEVKIPGLDKLTKSLGNRAQLTTALVVAAWMASMLSV